MKKQILWLFILFLSFTTMAYASDNSGKRLYLYGDSAKSLGKAGTGVSSFGHEFFYLNPASVARYERFGIGFQYGTLNAGYYNPDISFAIPTSYGVVGATLRYYNLPDTKDFKSAYSIQLGGAKDFTERLMLGASLNFVYGENGGNLFYIGASIGAIYEFKGTKHKKRICVYEPKLGISINGGAPIGKNQSNINFNSFTIGYSFQFLRYNNLQLKFNNDFSLFVGDDNTPLGTPVDFPLKFGFDIIIFKNYILRIGTMYPYAYDYGVFTLGAGYNFNRPTFAGSINYAFNYYNRKNQIHYISFNFEYGKLDREPPETEITLSNKYFSPNHDGEIDYVHFNLNVNDTSRIKGWKLQITDERNNIVKEYKMSERDMTKKLTAKGFFKRFFQKKVSFDVPSSIMWDGTDKKGEIVEDGKYNYSFTAWDERDNIAEQKKGIVILDNTPSTVKLKTRENLFSPNGDGKKDKFIIKQVITTYPGDKWEAAIKNSKGLVVKKYTWEGNSVPFKIIWDGKNDNGEDVPEGLYYYKIKTRDNAGNRASEEIKEISLTREYEIADITISAEYFSFNKSKSVNLFPDISKTRGLEKWEIVITDSKNKEINKIAGTKKFQRIVTWNCKDSNGKELKNGEYFIKLYTQFKSGNTPSSFKKKLIIDSSPPELATSHSPDLFSPDGDGERDILTMNQKATDETGIKNWKLNIYAPSGEIFKSYSGEGNVPDEIKWDGLSEEKDIVESAADYFIELEAVDFAGNESKSGKKPLHVDILVVVTERGLKMRISNIEFAFGSSDLKRKSKSILNRVHTILQKYDKYNVIIEGHTDDIGDEDYNLKLSEIRAKAVYEFILKKGIDEERIEFVGMGETIPLYPNKGNENRRRNRRVEFLLIKMELD